MLSRKFFPVFFLFLTAQLVTAQCPEDFYAEPVEESCDSWVFEIGSFVEGESVFWDYGDGTSELGGHFTDHTYAENGEYQVCGIYWSPLCPDTAEYCETIVVECATNPCELDVEVVEDGDVLYFTPNNYPDSATIFWTVNDSGAEPGEEFTFELNEPGSYQICAAYETPECPQGVFWCETWTVEGESDCPTEDDFDAVNVDGNCTSWVFEIGSFVEGEEVYWDYGDGSGELGGHFTDHTYQEDGEYEVCGYYHSPLCPDTVILCQTIVVECNDPGCELDMEIEEDGDTLLFYPYNYPDNATIGWQLNEEWMGTGDLFSISIAEPGTYQVCASYETPECPQGVTWCETWTVEEDDCPFELSVDEAEECGCYELALNGQWGSEYYWNLGDSSFTNNSNSVIHCYEPGNYTGYVQIFESNYPECEQQPVVFSLEVPECEGDCPTALTYEELECGLYEFTIEGGNEDSEVFWNFGNEAYQSDGSPHTHYFEEGFYTVYIMYLDENCQSETYIVELEVPDCEEPECTWFEFEVATNADILPIELDWSMTSQEGATAGAGSVALSEGIAVFSGEACLMAGCYTLTLSSDFPIGLGDFEFDFPTIPGVPINIDWIQDDNPYTLHTQIDLAGDCDWTVGLDENQLESAVVYPVPTSGELNIRLENEGLTEVRFYDATGKLLKQKTISQSGQIGVGEFSAGYYVLQLQQGKSIKTFSVPLLN